MISKMLKYAISLIAVFALFACTQNVPYRIEGKLANLGEAEFYAVFENENGCLVDTVMSKPNGSFSIVQKEGNYQTVTLLFDNKSFWRCIFLEAGKKVKVSGDANYPVLFDVKGGDRINEKISDLRGKSASLWKEKVDLTREINRKQANSIEEADLIAKLTNVEHQLEELAVAYIKKNPEEPASLALIQYFFTDPNDTREVDELLAVVSPKLRDHFMYKALEEYCTKAKRTNLGAEAPTFKVKNVLDREIDMAKLNDKYTLLAFILSCNQKDDMEKAYLASIIQKHKKDSLDVVVLTLDNNAKEIRNIIKGDTVQWNIVADSANQVAMLLDLYNISELPHYYLIDKDKKILMKTENNMEVRDSLDDLFTK